VRGWKSGGFFNTLKSESPDGCLHDNYQVWLQILNRMLIENLGDSFMIHHITLSILDFFLDVKNKVSTLWDCVLNDQPHTLDTESILLKAKSNYGLEFGQILPVVKGEPRQYSYQRHVFALPERVAELIYESPRSFQQRFLKENQARDDVKAKRKRASDITIQQRPQLLIVKQYLQALDVLASRELQTWEAKATSLATISEPTHKRYRIPGKDIFLETKKDPHNLNRRVEIVGPFNLKDHTHRLVAGGILFRSRKLHEWTQTLRAPSVYYCGDPATLVYRTNTTDSTYQIKEPISSIYETTTTTGLNTTAKIRNEIKETKERRNEPNPLFYVMYTHSNEFDHKREDMVLNLVLRCLLGLDSKRVFTASVPIFGTRGFSSYQTLPAQNYPVCADLAIGKSQQDLQKLYAQQKFLFYANTLRIQRSLSLISAWKEEEKEAKDEEHKEHKGKGILISSTTPCMSYFYQSLARQQSDCFNLKTFSYKSVIQKFLLEIRECDPDMATIGDCAAAFFKLVHNVLF